MKQIPYWQFRLSIPRWMSNGIKYAYKPNKPSKPKALAGTGGFRLHKRYK